MSRRSRSSTALTSCRPEKRATSRQRGTKSVGGFPSTAEETEYCADESSDRGKHAKDARGNGIHHHYDRVRGRARRDHDNAATRCDKQRRENAECHEPQQEEDHPAHDYRSRNASNQAARGRRPCDRLMRCVHNRLSLTVDLLVDFGIDFFAAGHATSRTPQPLSLVQNSWFKTTGS